MKKVKIPYFEYMAEDDWSYLRYKLSSLGYEDKAYRDIDDYDLLTLNFYNNTPSIVNISEDDLTKDLYKVENVREFIEKAEELINLYRKGEINPDSVVVILTRKEIADICGVPIDRLFID